MGDGVLRARRRGGAIALTFAAASFAACPAWADGVDPAAAAELFRQGREALLESHYDVACPRLAESQRLDPKVGTLINLARCEEAIDRRASAMRHWDDAVKLAHANGDAREAFVTEQRDRLGPVVPRLAVKLADGVPQGTRVTLDGADVAPADLGTMRAVDAGAHVLVASDAAGNHRYPLTVVDEDVSTVTLDPRLATPVVDTRAATPAPVAPAPEAPVRETPPTTPSSRGDTQRLIAYATGGAAVFALGLGAAWGLQAINARNDPRCTSGVCDAPGAEAQREGVDAGNRSNVAFVVGGVLVAGGVALWLTAPRDHGGVTAWIAPAPQGGGGSAGLRGTW